MATAARAEPVRIGSEEYSEVLDFLYREARLLDTQRLEEWLETMTADVEYHMPQRLSRMPKDGPGFEAELEYFSENHSSLRTRVARLQTEQAWAEQPASRTRHFVSNTVVERTQDGEYLVRSNFFVTRTRADLPYDMFTGEREDTLRRDESGELRLARRMIWFDQTVLRAYNLSIFF
jgi:3-phenylpropionate/cinnamic acid dioxygenase small subunit